jgi:hypothetical protein
MKIEFGKHCNLMVYKWHSINLVPALSLVMIASDDKIDPEHGCSTWDGTIVGHAIELVLFGIIFNFMYPSTKYIKQFIGNLYGPLWSRKRNCWYRAPKD